MLRSLLIRSRREHCVQCLLKFNLSKHGRRERIETNTPPPPPLSPHSPLFHLLNLNVAIFSV
ncbi:hypothetical protein LguiA_025672 [Lonicera macranthoides]